MNLDETDNEVRTEIGKAVASTVPPEVLEKCVRQAVTRYLDSDLYGREMMSPLKSAVESALREYLSTAEAKSLLAERAKAVAQVAIMNATVEISSKQSRY